MNIPENVREFNLQHAQQGAPLVTRDKRPVKFIAYVPENEPTNQVIVSVAKLTVSVHPDGSYLCVTDGPSDLFMALLGYCEGKPVFVGDVLVGIHTGLNVHADASMRTFDNYTLPSKAPVVKTRMSIVELYKAIEQQDRISIAGIRNLANKAIERAIADGDVIPTSVVKNLLTNPIQRQGFNPEAAERIAQGTINIYLEGPK